MDSLLFKKPWQWFKNKPLRRFQSLTRPQQFGVIAGIAVAILIIIPMGTFAVYYDDLSNREKFMNRSDTGLTLLDRDDTPFFTFNEARLASFVELESIPDHAKNALIAAEDDGFYSHSGVSPKAIAAAMWKNVTGGELKYGGSTITQQLVKNALLTKEKSFFRKYQEFFLSIAADMIYEKNEILEMYFNSVYFGEGAFGIEAAAETYFGKSATDLNRVESAYLIGMLPSPSSYSPYSGSKEAGNEQQARVLRRMAEEGHISQEQLDDLISTEISFTRKQQLQNMHAQHFAFMVRDQLIEEYGEERVVRAGFTVKTTLDLDLQAKAEDAVKSHIESLGSQNVQNGAAVIMDPTSGDVLALVGSADWFNEEFGKVNMATTPRQPGSSFKPIYYSEALEQGVITAATILKDEPRTFGDDYRPENFDNRFRGDVTVRRALANSLNVPSVAVLEKLGVDNAVETATGMGLDGFDDDEFYGLSMALGTEEVKLLNMAEAYSSFANEGEQYKQRIITKINDKFGKTLKDTETESRRTISKEGAFLTNSILADNQARVETFGNVLSIGRPAAVKTGTTENAENTWAIGYTPQITVGVWVGNNDHTSMRGISSLSGAAPLWNTLMNAYLQGKSVQQFTQPPQIVSALICRSNGLRAPSVFEGVYKEFFIRDTVPTDKCEPPSKDDEKQEKKNKNNEKENKDDNGNGSGDNSNENDEDDTETNNPPSASFEYTKSGLTVNFSDTSSDSNGSIESWNWDFGDENTSSQQNPEHTYSEAGTYTVTLTVIDDEGASDEISQEVTVSES